MKMTQIFRALGPIDLKSVGRDSLLRWMVFLPLVLAAAARWAMPPIIRWIGNLFAVDLLPYYSPIMGYALIVLTPFLAATVVGFLLLDQRDDGTLTALQVTPLSLNGYLLYRLATPMLAGILATMIVIPLSGVISIAPIPLLLVVVGAAPLAPLMAVILAVIAQNKVQGFAVLKVSSIVLLPPMIAYFVQGPWHLLLALVPTYWPAMMLWTAVPYNPSFWFFWSAGLAYQMLLLAVVVRRFNRIMRR
jgi:fluoroquinolone transport system permease protein